MSATISTNNKTLICAVGEKPARFLASLDYLLRKEDFGFHKEGRKWIFNTYKLWKEKFFEFWSIRTLKRIVAKLKRLGILIVRRHNARLRHGPFKEFGDQTNFYTIDYDRLAQILNNEIDSKTGEIISRRNDKPEGQNGTLGSPENDEKPPRKPHKHARVPKWHDTRINEDISNKGNMVLGGDTRRRERTHAHTHTRTREGRPAIRQRTEQPERPEQPQTEPAFSLLDAGNATDLELARLVDGGRIGLAGPADWKIILKARKMQGLPLETPLICRYCPRDVLADALRGTSEGY